MEYGTRWEHKVIERRKVEIVELNAYGDSGWQLVQIIEDTMHKRFIIYLKRQKM